MFPLIVIVRPENDVAIVPDIGIAASFDPVALDQACVDMVNNATALHELNLPITIIMRVMINFLIFILIQIGKLV